MYSYQFSEENTALVFLPCEMDAIADDLFGQVSLCKFTLRE